jgi:hypothetical protein
MGLCHIKKFLDCKRNNYKSEETAYRMGEKSLAAIQLRED